MVNLANVDFQQQAAAKSLGIDLPPDDPTRIRIRIKSRTHNQVVAGICVPAGESTHDIYQAHLPEFQKLLETASQVERETVQRMYEDDVRDAEGQKTGIEGREYRKPYDPSYPAAFRAFMRRDLLPFDLVETIKTLGTAEAPEAPKQSAQPQQQRR